MDVHYHGVINFKMDKHHCEVRFRNAFRNHPLFGFVNLKVITDEPGWIDYLRKDLSKTAQIIFGRPILIDEFNCFRTGEFDQFGIQEIISDQ